MEYKKKCCVVIALALAIKKREEGKTKKKIWMQSRFKKRHELTQEMLLKELKYSSPYDFRNFLHIDSDAYRELLQIIEPKIAKADTMMRKAISANQRLYITLRFLATGESFSDLMADTYTSQTSIGKFVIETCLALTEVLSDYLQLPKTQDEWKNVANEFYNRWNFPNCIGALDGMHVAIQKPSESNSEFYNYKQFFSIVLFAVVNANYEFLMVDADIKGNISDEGVLSHTNFGEMLEENSLNIPEPTVLPDSYRKLPFVFLGDDAFHLTDNLMKPYDYKHLVEEHYIFNYHLNRARRIAENTLGILVTRFGVLQRTMALTPRKAQTVLLACCYLHNYLRKKYTNNYIPANTVDSDNIHDGSLVEGSWRQECDLHSLQNIQTQDADATESAKYFRDEYCGYFNYEGQV